MPNPVDCAILSFVQHPPRSLAQRCPNAPGTRPMRLHRNASGSCGSAIVFCSETGTLVMPAVATAPAPATAPAEERFASGSIVTAMLRPRCAHAES